MIKRFEHGGNIYEARRRGRSGSISVPTSIPWAFAGRQRSHDGSHRDVVHYPDPKGTALRGSPWKSLRRQSRWRSSWEMGQLNSFISICIPFAPVVLIPVPSFSEYERAARAGGAAVDYCHLQAKENFAYPWDTLRRACGRVDCIVIGNPNNPTDPGLADELEALAALAARKGTDIIVDESFLDFLPSEEAYSVRRLAQNMDSLFVIRSLTKFYACRACAWLWRDDALSAGPHGRP